MERFAFLLHPLRMSDFTRKFPWAGRLPETWVEAAFARVPAFRVSHVTGVRDLMGREAQGDLYALPMTPRYLMERPFPWVLQRLVAAGRKAEADGARIFGLGAFTKIVGDRGISVARALSIPVTTGNSYTVATAVEGALLGARRMGIPLEGARAAVVGATGSIGQAVALLLARDVGALTLVGRRRDALQALAERVRGEGTAEVTIATDPSAAARNAEIVMTVSSATEALIQPEDPLPGSVVCDVSRPRNVSARLTEVRDDVLVIDGGVIAVPGPVDFGFNFGFPPGTSEACMAETMILALAGRYECFTLGPQIQVEKVLEIGRLGKELGFGLSGFRRFERAIDDAEVEAIRERARDRTRRTASG